MSGIPYRFGPNNPIHRAKVPNTALTRTMTVVPSSANDLLLCSMYTTGFSALCHRLIRARWTKPFVISYVRSNLFAALFWALGIVLAMHQLTQPAGLALLNRSTGMHVLIWSCCRGTAVEGGFNSRRSRTTLPIYESLINLCSVQLQMYCLTFDDLLVVHPALQPPTSSPQSAEDKILKSLETLPGQTRFCTV